MAPAMTLADLEIQPGSYYNSSHLPLSYNTTFPGSDLRELDAIRIEQQLQQTIGNVIISKHSKNCLLLQLSHSDQRTPLLSLKTLVSAPVVITHDPILSKMKGVVKSKALSFMSIEDITTRFAPQGAEGVTRIGTTNAFILTFNCSSLPKLLKITSWLSEPITMYEPSPMRCKKC